MNRPISVYAFCLFLQIDCCIFGHLSQVVYVTSLAYPQREYMESHCGNILRYMDRIKDKHRPDWNGIREGEFKT